MYIRWQKRRRQNSNFGRYGEPDVSWSAVLVENKRVKGEPTQRHVLYVVGFTESQIKIPAQRCHLWDHIGRKLDMIVELMGDDWFDRKQIEAQLAKKLPRPTPAEYKQIARACAQSLGWKWITNPQRLALKDEAAKWRGCEGTASEIGQLIQQAEQGKNG